MLREITGKQQYRVFRAEEVMEIVERPATDLPEPNDLLDGETAWQPPEK